MINTKLQSSLPVSKDQARSIQCLFVPHLIDIKIKLQCKAAEDSGVFDAPLNGGD